MTWSLPATAAFLVACAPLAAQETADPRDRAIEDNSFFIEEAYNQEEGVVQHISNAVLTTSPERTLAYTFTQEWPLFSHLHQLSVTIPYSWVNGTGSNGPGDILINYRYQLTEHDDWASLAPRLSLILPSGDAYQGRGGVTRGFQLNIPASKRVTNTFVVHANVGMTLIEETGTFDGDVAYRTHRPTYFNAGASIIWLARLKTNLLLEYALTVVDEEGDDLSWSHRVEHTISPGIRQAVDIGSLQIVPGLALPLFIADGGTRGGTFFYLSFEHPF